MGRYAVLVGDDYEDLELWYPKLRLEEAGHEVVLAGLEKGGTGYRGKHGYPATSDARIEDLRAADLDGIVIPGGWMPDKLRRFDSVKQLVRDLAAAGKLVASICHGPWVVQSAGLARGLRMTSSPGIRDDLVYAGAEWVDAAVVVDGSFVTSRKPADLPEFLRGVLGVIGAG